MSDLNWPPAKLGDRYLVKDLSWPQFELINEYNVGSELAPALFGLNQADKDEDRCAR